MLVDLQAPWFGPTAVVVKDKIQHISGKRYKRGINEVPDELKDALPKGAKILEKAPKKKPVEEQSHALSEFDMERSASDAVNEVVEEANKTSLEIKQDRMAHARAAKKDKK